MVNFLYDHESIKPLSDTAFTLFGLEVKWYGICIVTGALVALFFGLRLAKKFKINEDIILDGFIIGMILGILGARLYYVIFQWDYYKHDLSSILSIRDGGLAIHGGIIAAAIFIVIYCRIRKIDTLKLGEVVAPSFFIGQIFGRFGNFFNQEATGPLVGGGALNWDQQRAVLKKQLIPDFIVNQMFITHGREGNSIPGYYYPTFLYEAIWNAIGLGIVILLRKKWKDYWVGDGICFYLMWYSIGRFMIEALRTDSLMIGVLKQAQVISVVLFLVGAVTFALRRIYRFRPMPFQEIINEQQGVE